MPNDVIAHAVCDGQLVCCVVWVVPGMDGACGWSGSNDVIEGCCVSARRCIMMRRSSLSASLCSASACTAATHHARHAPSYSRLTDEAVTTWITVEGPRTPAGGLARCVVFPSRVVIGPSTRTSCSTVIRPRHPGPPTHDHPPRH